MCLTDAVVNLTWKDIMTNETKAVYNMTPVIKMLIMTIAIVLVSCGWTSDISAQTSCLQCEEIYSAGEGYNHHFDSQGTLFRECEDEPDLSAYGFGDVTCHNNWRWGACSEHNPCGARIAGMLGEVDELLGNARAVEPAPDSNRRVGGWIDHEPAVGLTSNRDAVHVVACGGNMGFLRLLTPSEAAAISGSRIRHMAELL